MPFLILFRLHLKNKTAPKEEPNINELEEKLNTLIEKNSQQNQNTTLQNDLNQTTTNTISSYINIKPKKHKGFHLFQLIFTLIKNNTNDRKILKILRHYFPSCANSHLIAMLHSFKQFLSISARDNQQKYLLKDLYNNKIRSTLLYLEHKINSTINKLPYFPPSQHQEIIDKAVIYGLIFASFSEFYNKEATLKILKLSQNLSPQLFKYWHSFDTAPQNYLSILQKYNSIPPKKYKQLTH